MGILGEGFHSPYALRLTDPYGFRTFPALIFQSLRLLDIPLESLNGFLI
jgi:hypothetical protein